MKYKFVIAHRTNPDPVKAFTQLSADVETALNAGWSLSGDLHVVHTIGGLCVSQSLRKDIYEKGDEDEGPG